MSALKIKAFLQYLWIGIEKSETFCYCVKLTNSLMIIFPI